MATTLRSAGITMGSSTMDVGGSAPSFPCRAWVNFQMASPPSTRASGNISSISRNTTFDYTLNFTTALADANYAAAGIAQFDTNNVNSDGPNIAARRTTGAFSAGSFRIIASAIDCSHVGWACFRN